MRLMRSPAPSLTHHQGHEWVQCQRQGAVDEVVCCGVSQAQQQARALIRIHSLRVTRGHQQADQV